MAEDGFSRSERKLPPRTRPAPSAPSDEGVTVVCGCGVLMMLTWRTAEPVRCFGCGREFSPPPTATAAPLRWRPDLAAVPRPAPGPGRAILAAAAIAAVLLVLLGLAIGLLLAHP